MKVFLEVNDSVDLADVSQLDSRLFLRTMDIKVLVTTVAKW